jgi:hypothetical protein
LNERIGLNQRLVRINFAAQGVAAIAIGPSLFGRTLNGSI